MSYILDALKRADAERERGAVPGLHDHQATSSRHAGEAQAHGSWRRANTVLLALLVLAVAFWVWRDSASAVPPSPIQLSATTPPAPSPAPATTAPDASGASVPLQAVPLPSRPPVRAVTAAGVPTQHPAGKAASTAVAATGPVVRPAAREPRETPAPPADPRVARASVSGETLPYSDLPESVRKQIPALNISGAVYAESTQEWILLVNDRLVTQGNFVASDLRLEEVGASSAIFSFRGKRFRVEL